MKKTMFLIVLLALVATPALPARAGSAPALPAAQAPIVTDAYSLIAAVNSLRASNGLAAYSINPILMSLAQNHADYMAAIGQWTHLDGQGRRPFERALAAGYPLAGDLSQGGFYSENVIGPWPNLSVDGAVKYWQGDGPHLLTMLSADLREIGAGVAIVDGNIYYDIDCAQPTGSGKPQVYTPVPGSGATQSPGSTQVPAAPPLARTIVPNTPGPDGKLYHVVGPGETLWLIAISYGVKLADIRKLNNMTDVEILYPGRKLLIRQGDTPSPLPPTATRTPEATWTPEATLTLIPSATHTPVPVAPVASNTSLPVLGAIVLAALVLAGIFVQAGRHAR